MALNKIYQVCEGLYFSNELNAFEREKLVQRNIHYLINAGYPQCKAHFQDSFHNYKDLDLYQRADPKTSFIEAWDETCEYIDNAIDKGTSCLIYCKNGINLSVAVVVVYLIRKFCLSTLEAMTHCKSLCQEINIDKYMIYHIFEYELVLRHREGSIRIKKELLLDSKSSTSTSIHSAKRWIQTKEWNTIQMKIIESNHWKESIRSALYQFTKQQIENIIESYPDLKLPDVVKIHQYIHIFEEDISKYAKFDEIGLINALRQGVYSALYSREDFFKGIARHIDVLYKELTIELFDTFISNYMKCLLEIQTIVPVSSSFSSSYIDKLIYRLVKNRINVAKESLVLRHLESFDNVQDLCLHIRHLLLRYQGLQDQLEDFKRSNSKAISSIVGIDSRDLTDDQIKLLTNCNLELNQPILPEKVGSAYQSFLNYMDVDTSNKKLYILPQFGFAEIELSIGLNKYLVTVNTAMMCILYTIFDLYESYAAVCYDTLRKETNLPSTVLNIALHSILRGNYPGSRTKSSILSLQRNIPSDDIALICKNLYLSSDAILINESFNSKSHSFRIPVLKPE